MPESFDCLIVFKDIGAMHGLLDILPRNIYNKFVTNNKDAQLLGFNLTSSEYQMINSLAISCRARMDYWKSEVANEQN